MIRVAVVEDEALVREGIVTLLGLDAGLGVVAEAADGEEAVAVLEAARPDVALVDVRLPRQSGLELLAHLRARGTAPPTIFLTTFDDDAALVEALRLEARGFLLKDVTLERLAQAIRTVHGGGTVIAPSITERVTRGIAGSASRAAAPEEPLTPREREVVRLLAAGFGYREIAASMHLAEGTVKNHVSHVLSKLGARDRTQAVLRAIDRGWV